MTLPAILQGPLGCRTPKVVIGDYTDEERRIAIGTHRLVGLRWTTAVNFRFVTAFAGRCFACGKVFVPEGAAELARWTRPLMEALRAKENASEQVDEIRAQIEEWS